MTEPNKSLCNIFSDQKEFMQAGNQTVGITNIDQKILYERLVKEEYVEFVKAILVEGLPEQIKEANDILVVVAGWLHSVGIDPEKAWRAVHDNNMLKVANPPVKDEYGKIQKSPEAIAGKAEMMGTLQEMCE